MPRIVITHAIQDIDRWLGGKTERIEALPGAVGVTDLVALDGTKSAALTFEIDDLDAFKSMLSSLPRRWPPRRSRTGSSSR